MATAHELLNQHAHQEGSRWWFTNRASTHSEDEALAIVESCVILGTKITDILTSGTWHSLVTRLALLEDRVKSLEAE